MSTMLAVALLWVGAPSHADAAKTAAGSSDLAAGVAAHDLSLPASAEVVSDDRVVLDRGDGWRVELERRPDAERPDGGQYLNAVDVGFGWYVYLYATGSELNYWSTLSAGFLASIICGVAITSVVGAAACSSLASAVYAYVANRSFTSWRCYELRFTYAGSLVGVRSVATSLC